MPLRVTSSRSRTTSPPVAAAAERKLPFDLPIPPAGIEQKPAGLSLCMIVRNEERYLEGALRSVAGIVDEINIVDTGSTDGTLEIAREYGARVEHRAWRNDFAWARNEALAMARYRWIVVLDADEELAPQSRSALESVKAAPAHLTGIWVRCLNVSDDYKGTGSSSHALARIFPNHPRLRYHGPIHEFITLDESDAGIEARLSTIEILHYGYLQTVVKERRKAARNYEIILASTQANPTDPFNWYNLGNTALLDGRHDEGIAALERMRELVGEQARGYVAVGLSMLADAYTDFHKDPQRGIDTALESLRKSPKFANAHFALGRAYARLERYDEAREAFRAAIADAPFNARQFVVDDEVSAWKAHSEIGHTYGKQGQNDKALEWFELALVNRPDVQPLVINRARALEACGRIDEATRAFREMYLKFRDDAATLDYVNFLLRHQGYDESLSTIDEALPALSAGMAVKMLVTAAAVAQRFEGDARSYLDRARALAPGSALVLGSLEAYYHARGDREGLERLHLEELEAPCVEPDDFARRASRYLMARRPAEALEAARSGLELHAEHGELAYDAAAAIVQLGDREAALAYLDRVRPADGTTFGKATFLRSIVAYDLGRDDEALAAIDTVLAANVLEADAHVHRAKILERLERIDDAAATLRPLARGDRRIAIELAGLLMRHGRHDEARVVAEEALVTA